MCPRPRCPGHRRELHDIALDLETNVHTSWALIFFHMTRYWFTMQYGAASQHAETI